MSLDMFYLCILVALQVVYWSVFCILYFLLNTIICMSTCTYRSLLKLCVLIIDNPVH